MFLKCHPRVKDGKEHRYWSVVENRRCGRGKWSSGKSFTLEKSTTVSAKAGAERSKSSMSSASGPCPWHYFPLIGSYPTSPQGLGCRYGSKRWNCIGLGNGEPVGWPVIFTSNWAWMSSGPNVWVGVVSKFPCPGGEGTVHSSVVDRHGFFGAFGPLKML